jgi:glucose uptake protein GlcU
MITSLRRSLTSVSTSAITFLGAAKAYANNTVFGSIPSVTGGTNDVRMTVTDVLGTVLNFLALVAVVFIVIAGIRLIVSQGEEGERDKAKKTIIYVIIGLIVILLARAIVAFVTENIANATN